MVRGLGKLQASEKEKTKIKILNYLQHNEPANYSQIVTKSGVSDRTTLHKRLVELGKTGSISKIKISGFIHRYKKGIHYYKKPASQKIQNIIKIELYLSRLNFKYYFGIKKGMPLNFQYLYKLKLLTLEKQKLEKKFTQQVSHIQNNEHKKNATIINNNFIHTQNTVIIEFWNFYVQKEELEINWSTNGASLMSYFEPIMQSHIHAMDKVFKVYKEIKSRKKFPGPLKIFIADKLIDDTIRKAMRNFNAKSKLGAKIKKELFNQNDSIKVEAINKIKEEYFGSKDFSSLFFPSGEDLEKKRERITKSK